MLITGGAGATQALTVLLPLMTPAVKVSVVARWTSASLSLLMIYSGVKFFPTIWYIEYCRLNIFGFDASYRQPGLLFVPAIVYNSDK